MSIKSFLIISLGLCFIACSCKRTGNTPSTPEAEYLKVSPHFDADSAYHFVDRQVAFGYRVPNTKEHEACGNYLVAQLKRFDAQVHEQKIVVTAWDGTNLAARNIIGSFGLDKKKRILLFAHWDTRPYSDQEKDSALHHKPILGANDGASGVGVLLEVARIIQQTAPNVGVDIIFFDAEDYGTPEFADTTTDTSNTWCLGSQYWAKKPHIPNYKAKYGILLDMVGGHDAKFYKEYYSTYYAADVLEKIWNTARQLGYGKHFINKDGGGVTDDHVPVNKYRNIPSVDIIQHSPDSFFAPYWHTQKDDMSNVSKETLKVIGQTVLEVIYKEKGE